MAASSIPVASTKDGCGPRTSLRVRSAFARINDVAPA
jgi:hypothetical protein